MLTRSGWALLVVGVALAIGAATLHYAELDVLAAGCGVALVVAVVWRLGGPRLTIDRQLERDRVTVGDPARARVHVTNLTRRRVSSLVAVETYGSRRLPVELPRVAAGATAELAYDLPTERRGVVAVGPFVVRRADPLDLSERVQSDDHTPTLWIHPRVQAVAPLAAGLRLTPEGQAETISPQATLAFHSLREYVIGDDLRQIHWRSTAHTGTLMVRHNLDASIPTAVVVLDTRARLYSDESFEVAVEIAASLVVASARAHLPIRLVTTGGLVLDDHRAGERTFLDQLAGVDPDEHGRLVDVGRRLPRRRHGVALGLVTGQTTRADHAEISQLCTGFTQPAVVRVRSGDASPDLAVTGAEIIEVGSVDDFVQRWGAARR